MPALSIATSVPVPIAMPTSAAASAGASLTPSPAIATTRPSRRSRSTTCALLLGQHLGLDLVDAELLRHRLGRGAVVAGQHDDAHASRACSASSAAGRRRLDRIGDRDDARGLAVDREEDRGRAVAAAAARASAPAAPARCRAPPGISRCRARRVRRSTMPTTPLPVGESKPRTSGELDAALARRPRRSRARADARCARSTLAASRSSSVSSKPSRGDHARRPWACLRSACRSCRPPACRPSPCAPAPRRS